MLWSYRSWHICAVAGIERREGTTTVQTLQLILRKISRTVLDLYTGKAGSIPACTRLCTRISRAFSSPVRIHKSLAMDRPLGLPAVRPLLTQGPRQCIL
jgi:hypothetical protein